MGNRKAFVLIEAIVAPLAVLLTGAIVVSLLPLEQARQRKCQANLRKLVKDMRVYGLINDSFFPVAFPDLPGANTIGGDRDKVTPTGCGASRSLFLLVAGKYTATDAFICPSTFDTPARPAPGAAFDFPSVRHISYSYQQQKNNGADAYYPITTASEGAMIVLADRNPIFGPDTWDAAGHVSTPPANGGRKRGGLDKWNQNSYNHNQAVQAVAAADSSATTATTPNVGDRRWKWTDPADNTVKIVGDNIWTAADRDTGAPQTADVLKARPTTHRDSFLMP